jgi:uncharacterized protein YjbI with pentapeptide repeats
VSETCDFEFTRDDARPRFDDLDDDEFDELWSTLLDNRGVDGEAWSCPHDGVDGGNCLFHRDPDTVDGDDQVRALREALAEGGRERVRFVGARFADFDLEGVDLTADTDARVDFVCARFAGEADFEGCTLPAPTFVGATFEGRAWFDDATFRGRTYFDHVTFCAEPRFVDAAFRSTTSSNGTASFEGATLDDGATLIDAAFDHDLTFDEVDATGAVTFHGATVGRNVVANDAVFRGDLYLSAVTVDRDLRVEGCEFFATVDLSRSRVAYELDVARCWFYRDETDVDRDPTEVAPVTPVDDRDPVDLDRLTCDVLRFTDCVFFRELRCVQATVETLGLFETRFASAVDLSRARFALVGSREAWFGGRTKLVGCRVDRSEFRETTFDDYLNAQQSTLTNADLSGCEVGRGTFAHADLTAANLSGLDLPGVDLSSATLSRAVLKRTDLRGADLSGAALGDVHLDDETRLLHPPVDAPSTQRRPRIGLREAVPFLSPDESYCGPDPEFEPTGDLADLEVDWPDADPDEAKTLYRTIETVAGDNSRPTLQSRAFVRGQDLRHAGLGGEGPLLRYLFSRLQRGVFVYGESFARVVVVSLAVVLLFGLLYPLGGLTATVAPDGTTTPLTYARVAEEPVLLWRSVYHSAMMFATGNRYGGVEATTTLGQAVTSVEALLGPTMLALVVFVLGRRAAR